MPEFAVLIDNSVAEIRNFSEAPPCRIINGLPSVRPFIRKTPAKNQQASGYSIFDDRVETRLIPADLETYRMELLSDLQKKRIEVAEGGMTFAGKTVPTDKEAIILLTSAREFLAGKPTKKLKRAGLGELSKSDLDAYFEALGAKHDAAFARESDLFNLIVAAQTIGELDAIDINSGW